MSEVTLYHGSPKSCSSESSNLNHKPRTLNPEPQLLTPKPLNAEFEGQVEPLLRSNQRFNLNTGSIQPLLRSN